MARARKPKVDTRPLVDNFIEVRMQKKSLEKEYDELRAQILALGKVVIKGTEKSVVVLERSRLTLDTEQLKLDHGIQWYNNYCHPTEFYELEVINNGTK